MFERLKEKFTKREEENDMVFKPLDEEVSEENTTAPAPTAPVATQDPAPSHNASVELKVIRPESYEEVSVVADSLLAGCTVVLNMEVLDKPTMYRMLDFLNGVTYCTDGERKRVSPSTFIITPHSDIDISDM